jgi:WD40 repeat protein
VWGLFGYERIISAAQQGILNEGKFSADGATVFQGLRHFGIGAFDRADFKLAKPSSGNFAVNDDASIVVEVTHNMKGEITAFNPKGEQSLSRIEGWPADNYVSSIEFSSDGTTALVAGGSGSPDATGGRVLVWNAATGRSVCDLANIRYVDSASFSHNGRHLVATSRDGTARIWAIPSCELRQRLVHGKVFYATFDRTDRFVATAGEDGTARIWDAATGQQLGIMPHEGPVRFLIFSPDNLSLLTISRTPDGVNSTMRLWDIAGYRAKTAPVVLGNISDAAANFSPDGRFIIAYDGPHGFRLWSTATLEPITSHLENSPEALLSHDNKGAPILIGIGDRQDARPRVVPWSLPSDARDPNQIVETLELLANRRFDSTEALVRLTPEELKSRWDELAAAFSNAGRASRQTLFAWHRREVEECELAREWFCVTWHIARLKELDLAAVDAALYLSDGRALAELERWSDAEAEYSRARAMGALDAQTLSSIARLRLASGDVRGQQALITNLIEHARGANLLERTDLLHAALLGALPIAEPERKLIREIVEADLRDARDGEERADARDILGALLYRSGDIQGALGQLETLKSENYLQKNSVVLFAMAKWRAGDHIAAKDLFNQAQTVISDYAGKRRYEDGGTAGSVYWYEWLELRVLQAEAAKLMGMQIDLQTPRQQ